MIHNLLPPRSPYKACEHMSSVYGRWRSGYLVQCIIGTAGRGTVCEEFLWRWQVRLVHRFSSNKISIFHNPQRRPRLYTHNILLSSMTLQDVTVIHTHKHTGRALDLWSTGRGFKSYSGQELRNNLGQVVHTYVPLSPSSIPCHQPRGGDAVRLGR